MSAPSRRDARAALAAVTLASLLAAGCSGTPPATLGPAGGGLAPCPSSPNCVHTGLGHPEGVEPLRLADRWTGDRPGALEAIAGVLEEMPRTEVVERGPAYVRAEATSRVFRFVDDVEVLLREDGEVVVRSASRVGYSDMGVNRRRVAELRARLEEAGILRR